MPREGTGERTAADAPLLEVRGLVTHYGRIQALHEVSVEIAAGELVALVGGNGAGKTTLLRTISGIQPQTAGDIRFLGESIVKWPSDKRVEQGIAQVPEGRQVFGPMTVEDNLRLGAFFTVPRVRSENLEKMFALFPILKERRRQLAGTLSGGQQQMLAIARGLMGDPKLLLLDEPSMGLAPNLVEEIFAVIERLKTGGTTIFLVEQNAFAALQIADRGYVLETGRIMLHDDGPALLRDEKVKEAYLGF